MKKAIAVTQTAHYKPLYDKLDTRHDKDQKLISSCTSNTNRRIAMDTDTASRFYEENFLIHHFRKRCRHLNTCQHYTERIKIRKATESENITGEL